MMPSPHSILVNATAQASVARWLSVRGVLARVAQISLVALASLLALIAFTGATLAQASTPPLASDVLAPDAATRWPRLFFTPTQRNAIVRLRQNGGVEVGGATVPDLAPASAAQAPPPVTAFVLQGLTQGPLGSSAWINGLVLRNGEAIGGRTVHIEPQGVRLSQAGQPDIRLKPGQQSPDAGQLAVDVVPVGSFLKK
jgi:hypothetical protein